MTHTDLVAKDTYRQEYSKDFVSAWDDLIGWDGREAGEQGFFQRILSAHGCRTVADVACGTGFHAVVLTRDGFEVTATDGSENMVRKTSENAKDRGIPLKDMRTVDWLSLADEFGPEQFDGVICLGNALSHLFDHEMRRQALRSMYTILKPGGVIVVDHRNYDAILDRGFSTKHKYYYTGHGVEASPGIISDTLVKFDYKFPNGDLYNLQLYPLRQNYMAFLLEDAGFSDIIRYGDFSRPYHHYEADYIQQVGIKARDGERYPM